MSTVWPFFKSQIAFTGIDYSLVCFDADLLSVSGYFCSEEERGMFTSISASIELNSSSGVLVGFTSPINRSEEAAAVLLLLFSRVLFSSSWQSSSMLNENYSFCSS